MKIIIGTDHAGFELKEKLVPWLKDLGHEVEDKGAFSFDPEDDYPDFIVSVAREVSSDPEQSRGIVLGGSGDGEAMLANRFPNVRAALFYGGDLEIVRLSRQHNNANILSFGARFVSFEEAKNAIQLWLREPFSSDEKYSRRINKAEELSKNK